MADITRFDPFNDAFDDFFKGFFLRPVRFDASAPQLGQFKVDVSEEPAQYNVKAELPGVAKEDIHVSIDGPRLSIAAEVKRESEEKKQNLIRSERYFGRAQRSFALDSEIDAAAAKAEYKDGILQLILPKKVTEAVRKIQVS